MRITAETALLSVIDVQERLTPHIYQYENVVSRIVRVVAGMHILHIPIMVNEQYKKGLGDTVEILQRHLTEAPTFEKVTFSSCDDEAAMAHLRAQQRRHIILCGIETHVCIMQTALDLLEGGLQPVIICDAVGSRFTQDHETALQRLQQAGAMLTTSESLLFELCRSSNNPAFKLISQLVK